ncbi:Transmembrane protein [Armadillidium vulgare]|nr:Transmembrane protein [Armadillidium vulgare]
MDIRRSCFFIVFLSVAFIVESDDSQSMEYDPLLKKEQPDFVDDTGFAAVDIKQNVKREDAPPSSKLISSDGILGQFSNSTNLDFTHAFVASLTVIIVSEIGDKTFFIAAIMAMTNPRFVVFAGAMLALAFMHILASVFGYVITYIPRVYTFYASAILFVIFGLKMMREGCKMKPNEAQEEFEEVQMTIRKREEDEDKDRDTASTSVGAIEEGRSPIQIPLRNRIMKRLTLNSPILRVLLEAFTLTFLAEWGDRSQLATVVLAASNNIYGIIVGGLLGHFLCTGLAVVGGKLIAAKISIRTVTIIGGIIFLIFAAAAFVMGP